MNKVIKFGETVEGYNIPVLNEREIRAAAGILFLVLFFSIMQVVFKGNFLLLKYFITIFLTDLIIRVFINPKFSPLLIIGRLIVRNQNPEYVGAPQKKFAWQIGLVLATLIFFLLIVINSHSPITGSICIVCLIFLFFESAFGICLGCLFYDLYYKEKAKHCPGEVCDATKKHNIQKTSTAQIVIVFSFIVYVLFTVLILNDNFSENPNNLWDMLNSTLSE